MNEEATVWVVVNDGSIYSISSERTAASLAEKFEGVAIYFFASLHPA